MRRWRLWWRRCPLWSRRLSAGPGGGMAEEALREALAVAESAPLWCGVMEVLGEHVTDATEIARAAQTAASPPLLAHTAGGLDALLTLREDLEQRRAAAGKGD